MWVKHPRSNKKDTMLTLTVFAFIACVFKFMTNGMVIGEVNLGSVDATLLAALLTPVLTAYTARKWKDSPDKVEEKV